jgi:hypothetical protein
MASTFTELRDEILSFVNVPEAEGFVPTFIALAEADMARELRHWQMEARATTTLAAQYVDKPTDWLETIRFIIPGKVQLEAVNRATMTLWRARQEDATGRPRFYSHSAGQFELWPTPDGSYTGEIVYYRRPAPLTAAAPENYLLDMAPDAYLYGALTHAGTFLADERAPMWQAAFQSAVGRINGENSRAVASGLRLSRR